MKNKLIRFFILLILIVGLKFISLSQELNQNLQILQPLLNKTWEGKLKAPDGSVEFKVVRTYKLMDKGNVIKYTKTNQDLNNYGEGFFYWDDINKKIAFFFIENGGIFNSGFVSVENSTIILDGTMTWPTQANPNVKQTFEFKNTFEFAAVDQMTDKWFQNAFGPWRSGHTIEFTAKSEQPSYAVIFYSGRTGDQDIFIKYPAGQEPINLTNHPAKDNCPATSPDGKHIIFLSDRNESVEIYKMNTAGTEIEQLTFTGEKKEHPEFSPDGNSIIFIKDFDEKTEIWIMNSDGSGAVQLTSNNCRDERHFISPDGKKVIFMSNRDGNYEIYTMDISGANQKRLTNTHYHEIFPVWSPDGTKIAYAQKIIRNGKMQGCIRVMNADGSGDIAVTAESTRDENPMWSPDGKFIVFQSVRDQNFEVYKINSDGSSPVRLTHHPEWDGWASFCRMDKKM